MDNNQIGEYLLYSKLQDTIGFLGNNAIININVSLYVDRKDNGNREYYRREVQYFDKNGELCRKISRSINTYISIETRSTPRKVVVIRPNTFEFLRIQLLSWFETILSRLNEIYIIRDKKLYKVQPPSPELSPRQIDVTDDCSLGFDFGIWSKNENEVIPVLDVYLGDIYNKTQVPYPDLYAFIHLLRTFNIQQYAANMISSFEQQQIIHGLNMYDVTMQQDLNVLTKYKYEEPESIKNQRNNAKKGFFDMEIERRNHNGQQN